MWSNLGIAHCTIEYFLTATEISLPYLPYSKARRPCESGGTRPTRRNIGRGYKDPCLRCVCGDDWRVIELTCAVDRISNDRQLVSPPLSTGRSMGRISAMNEPSHRQRHPTHRSPSRWMAANGQPQEDQQQVTARNTVVNLRIIKMANSIDDVAGWIFLFFLSFFLSLFFLRAEATFFFLPRSRGAVADGFLGSDGLAPGLALLCQPVNC